MHVGRKAADEETAGVFEETGRGDVFVWARTYDWLTNLCTFGAPSRAYRRAARLLVADVEPLRVLDIGTGTGAMAIAIKESIPAAEVHAVDPSEPMLDAARMNGVRAGTVVHFRSGWAQSLPFADDEFDAVAFAAVLHHIPSAQRDVAMSEARRVLRPGGRVLIVELVPARLVAGIVPLHRYGLDLDDCGRLLRATGFGDVRVGRLTRVLFGYATGALPPDQPRVVRR
jgi:ubiquinone/menaquinone biosynthesis C-methylase UbiE